MRTTLATAVVNLGAPLTDLDEGRRLGAPDDARGFVVVCGHLAGRVRLYGGAGVELVGPSDVVLLGRQTAEGGPVRGPAEAVWTALDGVQVAWLRDASWRAMLRHPAWSRALIDSQAQRVERLRAMQAASTLTRVDDRILGALWLLADRFGHAAADGTVVGLPLAHRLIGELIGARRPTVTTAISKLSAERQLSRGPGGRWVLHGARPEPAPADVAVHSLVG